MQRIEFRRISIGCSDRSIRSLKATLFIHYNTLSTWHSPNGSFSNTFYSILLYHPYTPIPKQPNHHGPHFPSYMTPTNIISLKNSFWISPPYWSCYCYCYCFFSSAEGATSGWTKAPASSNIFFNSPDLYKSVTISHPPIKSPLINNWGNVGQSLFSQNAHNLLRILLQILPHRRTCENVGTRKVAPYSQNNIEKLPNRFRMFTTRKLNPQRGAVGVPFINNITLFSCTIYFLTPTSSSVLYQWISILPPGSRPLPCFWAWSRRPTHLRSETKRTLSEVWNSFWTTVSTAGSPQENDTYYDQIYYTLFFAHGTRLKQTISILLW